MAEAANDTADTQDLQLQPTTSMQEPAAPPTRKRALSDPQHGLDGRPPKMPTIYEEQDSQEHNAKADDDTHPASVPLHHSDAPKELSTDAQTRAEKQHENNDANMLERPEKTLTNTHNLMPPTPSSAEQPTQPGASGTASPAEIFGYVPPDLRQQRIPEGSSVSHHPYFSPVNTRNVGLGISGVPNLPSISASSASSWSNNNSHARSRSYAGFYDGFTLPSTAGSPAATPPYSLYTSYGVQQPPTPSTNDNLTEVPASQGRFPFPAPPNSHMDHRHIPAAGTATSQIYTPQSWLPYPTSSSAASTTGSSSFSYIYGPTRHIHGQNISPERSYRNTAFPSPGSNNNVDYARRNSVVQMPQEQQMGSPASNHSPSRSRQVSDEDAQVLSRINALYEQYQKYGAGAEQRNLEVHERSFYRTVADRSFQQAHELASLMSLSKSVFGDSNEGNIAASPTKENQQQGLPPTNELASPDRNRASSSTSSSFLRGTPASQYQASPQLASQNRSPQRRYSPEQLRSIYQQQTKRFADFYTGMTPVQLEKYNKCSDSDKENIARALFRNIIPLEGNPSSGTIQAAGPASSSASSSTPSASLNNSASQLTSSQNHPPLLPLSAQSGLRASSNDETAAKDAGPSSAFLTTTQHNAAVRAEHARAQSENKDSNIPTETGGLIKSQPKTFNGRSISIRLGGVSTSTPAKVKPEPSDSNLESKVGGKSTVHEGDSTSQETSVILNAHNDSGIALDESPVKSENGSKQSTRDRTKTFEGLAAIAGRFIDDSPVKSSNDASPQDDEDSTLPKTEPNDEDAHTSTSGPQPFVFRGQRSKAFKKTVTNDFEGPQICRRDLVVDLDWDWNATVFQPLLIRFDDQTSPYQLSYNWSASECAANRRLVQYSSTFNADARELLITGRIIQPESHYRVSEQDGAVVSCIFKSEIERVLNKARTTEDIEAIYRITAPDVIKLMEAIIGSTKHHCSDLRGRIRSKVNPTNNRSIQVSKSGATPIERNFAKQIMDYDNPKPRVQDRPLRVTPWLELPQLLQKIAERFWVVV